MGIDKSRCPRLATGLPNRREMLTRGASLLAGAGLSVTAGCTETGSVNTHYKPSVPVDRIGKSELQGGPVGVNMPGKMGPVREIGGWPNLVEIADLALKHLNQICDPNYHYVPYVGATLGWKTPTFNHHRWDWIEVLPYPLLGRIIARRLTGSLEGQEIEIRQRQLLLSSFYNLDGFAYPHLVEDWGGGTDLCLWEQGRVLYALLAWFEDSGDERLLSYVRGMVQALVKVSHRKGDFLYINEDYAARGAFGPLSPVSMVECLAKYHEITGDIDALQVAGGLVRGILEPNLQFTDSRYRLSGAIRGTTSTISSIARFAAYTSDQELLDEAERLFRTARSLISRSGGTPGEEPCCTNMEMTTAGLALTWAGRGQWWDMIDRYFRNQTLACQFRDPSSVKVGSISGQPKRWDDTRDILGRSVGGFSWATPFEHLHWDRRLMLCCGGHALWTLGKIVENAVTKGSGGLSVNLHFSLDTPAASVTSHEPFEGLLQVVPNQTGDVKIRKPSYTDRVKSSVDGVFVDPAQQSGYLVFRQIRSGSRIELRYPLPEKTTEEIVLLPQQEGGGIGDYLGPKSDPVEGFRTATEWRGNTVLAINYSNADSHLSRTRFRDWTHQPQHRLYLNRRKRYEADVGRKDQVAFFLPERRFRW